MNDWIAMSGIGTEVTLKAAKEYAVQLANGRLIARGPNEGQALIALQDLRRELDDMGIPELYWPFMVEREVSLSAGIWYGKSE